ncbi:MAG: acyltransferase [Lachnospiraceae bacterium]|nr:acyltransferase [Lachnospiraceae bacterium]
MFWQKRLHNVFLPWLAASGLYALWYLITGGWQKLYETVHVRENGYLVITNSWFVLTLLLFCLIFFISFRKFCDQIGRGIFCCFCLVTLFIVLAYFAGLGAWWYYSSYAFLTGMLYQWSENCSLRKRSDKLFQRVVLILAATIFVLSYGARILNARYVGNAAISIAACLCASAVFPLMVFILQRKIMVVNRFWIFLGKISFEIYLLHELAYQMLRSSLLYIKSDTVYVLMVIFITIITAIMFQRLMKGFQKVSGFLGS